MRYILGMLAFVLFNSAHADDRTDKIRSLMEAQGLIATFDQQLQSGREQGRAQAAQILDQVLANFNPNPEFRKRLEAAVGEYMNNLQPPWGAKEIVDWWSELYGAKFTDEELDQLHAFYTSPLAQKEVAAIQKAMAEMAKQMAEKSKPVLEEATAQYVRRLEEIARECNCRK